MTKSKSAVDQDTDKCTDICNSESKGAQSCSWILPHTFEQFNISSTATHLLECPSRKMHPSYDTRHCGRPVQGH